DKVNLNLVEIASYLEGKTVLVTGGGGSIGSELCRQIARFNPKKLVILDIYENNAYDIQKELLSQYGDNLILEVLIASLRDRETIFDIVAKLKPNVIFHAAAHKHVPLMEFNAAEAVANNIGGTQTLLQLAEYMGPTREAAVSREISKHFEENTRGTLEELANYYVANEPKGEIVVVVKGAEQTKSKKDT
ncbi:MAG: NAD-dependent epimerase/dehydratase family protein, partial [Bacteroidia bacterium]|nr:NAD-dependent epimerase/dehydratase family protein [Bacteroidia bacterium]